MPRHTPAERKKNAAVAEKKKQAEKKDAGKKAFPGARPPFKKKK